MRPEGYGASLFLFFLIALISSLSLSLSYRLASIYTSHPEHGSGYFLFSLSLKNNMNGIPQFHIVKVHHFVCIGECGRNFQTTTLPEGKTIPKDKFICNECDPTMTKEKYETLLVDDEPSKEKGDR